MHILERCRDPYGKLSDSRKAVLEHLLEQQDARMWERARGLIIRAVPIITLEMAVNSVRRKHDEKSAPDPFTLYRALRFAVSDS
ncbi:MAG: hypothetical protein RQ736_01545 [Thiogranum sp.]|nr:hypothetical protein [Thiogranum sp.]